MTIKLLAAYDKYPVNSIVTLDAGTEAGLVAAKLADTTTTGGVTYLAPTVPNQRFPAKIESDATGNVTGIVGSDGLSRKLGAPRAYTALVAGDSISAFGEANVAVTSITNNGDGTATVVWTAHKMSVGQPIRMNVTASQATNVMDSTVLSVIDANTIKIALGGRTHKVTGGGAPNAIVPWRRGSRGWFNWMESALGVSFQATWCAVGGATSSQISDLVDATPMTAVADVGFMCIGMNDIYALGSSFAITWVNVKALADKVRARSAIAVFMAVPPRNSADSTNWTTAKQAVHTALNRRLHQYAQQVGAIFFDPSAATQNGVTYMDPNATYPDPLVPFMFDFTHPAARGAQAMGFGVAALVAPFMGVKAWKPAHRSHIGPDSGNILVNADMSASTAGVMNTFTVTSVTTGLSLTPTVVKRTKAADGDDVGYKQSFAVNYGTVASGFGLFTWQRTGIQSLIPAGSTIQWKTMFNVANAIGLCALEITILGTLPDGSTWQAYGCGLDGNTKGIPGSYSGALMTPPAVVPAGLTNVTISIRGIVDNTQTTDATIEYYFPELMPQI